MEKCSQQQGAVASLAGTALLGLSQIVEDTSLFFCSLRFSTHPRGRVIACTLLIKLISTQKTFFLSHLVVTRHLEPIVCCRTKSRFDCAIFPTHHIMCPDDHQDGMQPPCPPQYIFSLCASLPVSRHSEPLIIETRENRLSALVIGQPRPCRRPQSKRKVTTESIEWEMDDN